ncbi:glycosyltransferase family 2 protein [Vibrio gigantis]
MEPLVTVVVPYYNHQDYVIDALKSIHGQSYKKLQVIIIDDCSSDSGYNDILNYINKNCLDWKLLSNDKNIGLIRTIKRSLNYIEGDYVCVLASDDQWSNEKIELQLHAMLNGKIDCLSAGYEEVPSGKKIDVPTLVEFSSNDIIYGNYFMPALNLMWRAQRFKLIASEMKEDIGLEDYHMLLAQSLSYGPVYCLPGVLGKYRIHDNNTSSNREFIYNKKCQIIKSFIDNDYVLPASALDFQTAIFLKRSSRYIELIKFLLFRPKIVSVFIKSKWAKKH